MPPAVNANAGDGRGSVGQRKRGMLRREKMLPTGPKSRKDPQERKKRGQMRTKLCPIHTRKQSEGSLIYRNETGCGSAWLERCTGGAEVASSNLVIPTERGIMDAGSAGDSVFRGNSRFVSPPRNSDRGAVIAAKIPQNCWFCPPTLGLTVVRGRPLHSPPQFLNGAGWQFIGSA